MRAQILVSSSNFDSIKDIVDNARLHGWREILHSQSRALFYLHLTILVAANGIYVYNCYKTFSSYTARPIQTHTVVVFTKELQLPDLTFCSFNRLNREYLAARNISWELSNYIEHSFFTLSHSYEYIDESALLISQNPYSSERLMKLEAELQAFLRKANTSFEQFLHKASLKCTDVIRFCAHQQVPAKCCETAKTVWSSFGRCYRLGGFNQSQAGLSHGSMVGLKFPWKKYTFAENTLHNEGGLLKLTEPGKG